MRIEKNSRQMPASSVVVKNKDYCDLLYAWLQCNSERSAVNSAQRCIDKKKIKWTAIEKDFTVELIDGTIEKVMSRKTIAKYFKFLEDEGLVTLDANGEYYLLTILDPEDANLIEYNTLRELMNTLKRNTINIYIYLFNRYFANSRQPFVATMKQIKDYIGIATSTTSNNIVISDSLNMLQRIGLLEFEHRMTEDQKTIIEFKWVKNKLS